MVDSNNKATAARIATFLAVACMISAAAASDNSAQIDAMCSNAEYKETCQKTLSNANVTEPKELLLSAFNSTITNLKTAIRKSALYKHAAVDPRTKGALAVCEQVLNTTIGNMRRSFRQVHKIDDVKVWLSAGLTCKDTCVDAFENTTGIVYHF